MRRPDRNRYSTAAEFREAETRWLAWYFQVCEENVLRGMVRKSWVCPRCDRLVFQGGKLICFGCCDRYLHCRLPNLYGLTDDLKLLYFMAIDIRDIAEGKIRDEGFWPRDTWKPDADEVLAHARIERGLKRIRA